MMLHNEARNLLVKAYENNRDAKRTAADFSVSTSTVYRLENQMKRTGSVVLRVSQRGRKHLLSQENLKHIREQIEAQNDITIEEIRKALNLKASYSTVERAVRNMGYTYKKKSLYASERDRLRCEGKTYRVERVLKKSSPRTSCFS